MTTKWTLLVYLAANDDLDPFARQAVHDMEHWGSTPDFDVVVFADYRRATGDGKARRGRITKNANWDPFNTVIVSQFEEVGPVNTGDPSVLSDFIVWGVTNYPAQHYGLVIWGHGSGWKPDFVYQAAEKSGGTKLALAMKSINFADAYSEQTKRLLFRPTLEQAIDSFIHQSLLPNLSAETQMSLEHSINISPVLELRAAKVAAAVDAIPAGDFQGIVTRAIAYDETSHQGLDSKALRDALKNGADRVSTEIKSPLVWDLLGFDACMMAGVEVCYQVRSFANLIVGSEEIEPGRGWSYDLIIQTITQLGDKASEAATLGKAVVDDYAAALADYKIRLVTQSATASNQVGDLLSKVDQLALKLTVLIDSKYGGLARAEKTATRFYDTDYLDLGNYLENLQKIAGIEEVAQSIQDAVEAYKAAIFASAFLFPSGGQAPTGLSIYYPTKPSFDQSYLTLDAAGSLANWIQFVKRYHFLT